MGASSSTSGSTVDKVPEKEIENKMYLNDLLKSISECVYVNDENNFFTRSTPLLSMNFLENLKTDYDKLEGLKAYVKEDYKIDKNELTEIDLDGSKRYIFKLGQLYHGSFEHFDILTNLKCTGFTAGQRPCTGSIKLAFGWFSMEKHNKDDIIILCNMPYTVFDICFLFKEIPENLSFFYEAVMLSYKRRGVLMKTPRFKTKTHEYCKCRCSRFFHLSLCESIGYKNIRSIEQLRACKFPDEYSVEEYKFNRAVRTLQRKFIEKLYKPGGLFYEKIKNSFYNHVMVACARQGI
jgi:ribosomal protein S18